MTTSSADPENLREFALDAWVGRWSVEQVQRSTATLSANVVSASPYGGVSSAALASLATLLENMGANEEFVRRVRNELIAADQMGSRVVTVEDTDIQVALLSGGYSTAPKTVTITESRLVGLPQTSGFVDDPVCAANGNFIHSDHDLSFPGASAALNLHRFYNSMTATSAATTAGVFGAGWSSLLDVRLSGTGTGTLMAHLADGATIGFERSEEAAGSWSTTDRRDHRLAESGDGWVLRTGPTGERQWMFDADGVLTGWQAAASRVSVERDDSGRVARLVSERSGRSVDVEWTGDRIGAVTTDDGRRVDYVYDGDVLTSATSGSGRLEYVSDGALLVEARDLDGITQFVNVYDGIGRVVEQTSPFGRLTAYRYDDTGSTVITDERGVRQAMIHDARGNLISVVDIDGSAMRLTYDGADRVVKVVSKSGAVWKHEFDDTTGDLVRRVDPDGLSMAWTWDEVGRKLTETDRTGAVTTFEYDGDHRSPSTVIGPDGSSASAVLDGFGQIAELVDPDGVVTYFEWDRDGQLVAITDALGAVTSFDYDDSGLLTRLVDAAGLATSLHYDATGRVERAERGSEVSTYEHTPAGRVTAGVEPGDVAWSATFGGNGAVATIADAFGSTTRWEYDTIGNVVAVTAPDGAVYSQEYDDVGRLVAMSDPSGATSRKRYDIEGRLIGFVDAEGGVMRRTLDVLGRTVSSIAPDGAETTWTYHPNGEVASVTTPDGLRWATEIDVFGRLVAVVDPAGGRSENAYSPSGRLQSRTSPAGRTERFEYDPAGRCVAVVGIDGTRRSLALDERGLVRGVSVDGPDATPIDGGDVAGDGVAGDGVAGDGVAGDGVADGVEVVWDDYGRLAGYRSAEGSSQIERDAAGRVVATVDATGISTRYNWDRRGLLVAATDPAGATTSYRYDDRGRLIGQTVPGDRSTTWTYDPAGRVAGFVDPAGVATSLIRNANGYVTGQRRGTTGWNRTLDAAGRELERSDLDGDVLGSYTYDPAGRMTSATTPDHSGLIGSGAFTGFLWDDTGQLSRVTDATGTSVIERDADGWVNAFTSQDGTRTTIDRNASGRIVAVRSDNAGSLDLTPVNTPGDSMQARHDAAGRLLIGPHGTVYRYDDAGRLAEIAPPDGDSTTFEYAPDGLLLADHGPAGDRSFTYDLAGRVDSITVDGVGTTTIGYDDAGRRATETSPDSTRTTYRWNALDQLTAIERTAPDGTVERVSIDIDALGRPQRINGRPVGYDPIGGAPNLVGDIRIVTVGALSWRSDDESWGRTAPGTPEGLRIGGLTVLGARTYDPATRQFLSPDPLATVPATNGAASAYTYAWQDPINYIDPTGMQPVSIEAYDAIRQREEQGRLGQAWQAVKDDPWGSLAAVGVVVVGTALLFTPAAGIGVGILIGAGMSGAAGLATGNFSPTSVAVGGVLGGLTMGVGGGQMSAARAIAASGVVAAGGDAHIQHVSGQPIDWRRAAITGGAIAATFWAGHATAGYTSTITRNFTVGAATDGTADVAVQALTGDGHVNVTSAAFSAATGGGLGTLSHLTNRHTTVADMTPSIDTAPVRLQQDLSVNPVAPDPLRIDRPIGSNAAHNDFVQGRITELESQGATDFRVNQQQIDANGTRVGVNRPDLQYTLDDVRVYEEIHTTPLDASSEQASRLRANDPAGVVKLHTME